MRFILEKINRTVYIYKEYFILFVCILLSILFLLSNQNNQIVSIKIVIREFSGKVQEKFMWIPGIFTAIEENKILREKNVSLLMENSSLQEALRENNRLRKLLNLKDKGKETYIAADVIGRSHVEPTNTLSLNVGVKDGVKKNSPVINEKGLIGKIIEVGAEVSLCQLLTDRNFSVSAKVRENRAYGILVWTHDNYAEINIPVSFNVKKGYQIITSGFSNIYPPGIPIGKIVDFRNDAYGLFKVLKVKLNVNFYTIENAFVQKVENEFPLTNR